ncbi:Cyclic di-GMP phosphodiesterase response regulator RpfG [Methylophilaceae bacterium]|nr:Cyclic di-GMP phosphodiesterase response regulator RpfG [Methylophilaceae bacterium]
MPFLNDLFEKKIVLVLDDQSTSRSILSQIVKSIHGEIQVHEEASPIAALNWAKSNIADLVMVDYSMPEMNGIEFIRSLRSLPDYAQIPTIMITVNTDLETRHIALESGVTDFLTKPVNRFECSARCKNLLTIRHQHQELVGRSRNLEEMVKLATSEILNREKETLMRLARVGEFKDANTAKHLVRMSIYSRMLAEAIGMSREEAELIELSAPLHDIGKIGIPDNILLKKGPLTEEESAIMRRHPQIGFDILQDSPSKYLQKGAEIAIGHHERYDGTGYPNALAGDAIPLAARIVAIADVFDALTSARPYKQAWSIDAAMQYLIDQSNSHFDPLLVKAMLSIRSAIEKVHATHIDTL